MISFVLLIPCISGRLRRMPGSRAFASPLHRLAIFEKPEAENIASRCDGNVLFSVNAVGDRLSVNLLTGIKVPKHLSCLRIHGQELAVQFSGEDQSAGGRKQAAAESVVVDALLLPDELAGGHVESAHIHFPAVVVKKDGSGSAILKTAGTELLSGFGGDAATFEGDNIEEIGLRVVGGRHPVGGADVRGADLGSQQAWLNAGYADWPAFRRQSSGPVELMHKLAAMQKLAVGAVENVVEAVAIRVNEELAHLAFVRRIDEDGQFNRIPVHHVVGSELEVPLHGARVRIERHDALGVEVVAHAHIAVEVRRGVANSPIESIEFRIVTLREPGVSACVLPGVAGPGFGSRLS